MNSINSYPEYQLQDNLYPVVSCSGAFYCVASDEDNPSRLFLRRALSETLDAPLTLETAGQWLGVNDPQHSLSLLHQMQANQWISACHEPPGPTGQTLDVSLPQLLPALSDSGKVLLADSEGFHSYSCGFKREAAVEIAALSADIANLHQRHQGLLQGNLNIDSQSWGIMDSLGCNKLGFWPLFIGSERFVLVISGRPILNHPNFAELIKLLSQRYGNIES